MKFNANIAMLKYAKVVPKMYEGLYAVVGEDDGIFCVADYDDAKKEYDRVVEIYKRMYDGEAFDDDMGYKVILAKLEESALMAWQNPKEHEGELVWDWEESKHEN